LFFDTWWIVFHAGQGPVDSRVLPPNATDQVFTWATRLRDLANGKNVDWSDTWTEEDLADVQRASLAGFDEREPEEL
jgi:hypothetical protein